MDIRQSAPGVR